MVLIKGTSQHDDVVEVDQALRPLEASQDEIYQPLEGCGGVAQTKWHNSELEEALSVQNAVLGRSASSISTCQ